MNKEHYRIKELRGKFWLGLLLNVISGSLIYQVGGWKLLIGILLLIAPFAYRDDLIRNILRDYLLKDKHEN
jgi:hypothetical protein